MEEVQTVNVSNCVIPLSESHTSGCHKNMFLTLTLYWKPTLYWKLSLIEANDGRMSDTVTPLSWTSILIYYRRCVTLWIFQTSIQSPTKQLSLITVLVSLSSTYSRTIKDWNTLKNTDLTDKPSNDFRLFQNWISVTYMLYDTQEVQLSCTAKWQCPSQTLAHEHIYALN
jgi:hypothetical protein